MRRIAPREAHALMREGYQYLDVRSEVEFSLGHPAGALNIPFGPSFLDRVEDRFATDAKLIVGCASGVRSVSAAQQLISAGFVDVLEQRAGMDGVRDAFGRLKEPGWRDEGLPVSD